YLNYPTLGWYSIKDVHEQSVQAWTYLEKNFGVKMKRFAVKKTIFQIPAYPGSPRPVPRLSELKALLTPERFIAVTTTSRYDPETRRRVVAVRSEGLINPQIRFEGLINPQFQLSCGTVNSVRPLIGTWTQDGFSIAGATHDCFAVVDVQDPALPGGSARFFA